MIQIALFEPEIPPNTGNIIRLAANTGVALHLIEPLGFDLEEKSLRRAGLDYHEWSSLQCHDSLQAMLDTVVFNRLFAFTTKGSRLFSETRFAAGDLLLFGPESRGLPDALLKSLPGEQKLRIPMREHSRSLNLANAVSVATYEALRQLGFPDLN